MGRSISGGGQSAKPINVVGVVNVVLIGASIINNSIDSAYKRGDMERWFAASGVIATVYDRANGGETSGDLYARMSDLLAEFDGQQSNTVFVMHIGGNDVSTQGPYPGGYTSLNNNVRGIINDTIAEGFKIIPSSITYRIPPASNPSEPYNNNPIIPIIAELTPEFMVGDRPLMDLYTLTYDNQAIWHSVDGIHPTAEGELLTRQYIAAQVSSVIAQTGIDRSSYLQDAVINFGDVTANFMGGNNCVGVSGGPLTAIYEIDGVTRVVAECSIAAAGFVGVNTQNLGTPGDTSISLTNHYLLSSFMYTNTDDTLLVSIVGVDPLSTYDVSITAYRLDATSPRIGDYTVGGAAQQLDASDDPPSIITFSGVQGYDLLADGVQILKDGASSFAYLSGIRITKAS